MDNKEVGNRISELRQKRGYSREEFAAKVELSRKFLYEVESGNKGLSAHSLLKISNELSCSCDYLLTGKNGRQMQDRKLNQLWNGFEEKDRAYAIQMLELLQKMCVGEK